MIPSRTAGGVLVVHQQRRAGTAGVVYYSSLTSYSTSYKQESHIFELPVLLRVRTRTFTTESRELADISSSYILMIIAIVAWLGALMFFYSVTKVCLRDETNIRELLRNSIFSYSTTRHISQEQGTTSVEREFRLRDATSSSTTIMGWWWVQQGLVDDRSVSISPTSSSDSTTSIVSCNSRDTAICSNIDDRNEKDPEADEEIVNRSA